MALTLRYIYKKLFSHFGPQHWWPGETPFEVAIGAILTQNTNWLNVEKAINNLKKHGLLSPKKLYYLPEKRLANLIRSSGYYNLKARRLREFLKLLFLAYHGSLKEMSHMETRTLRRELLSVKGIGPETADSILLYAFGKPVFVVDAYTKRVFSRHRIIKEGADYADVQDLFMRCLKEDVRLFNEYHALIVKLGKDFCLRRKPKCDICPLK
jgi:endonuclease-3 related protein